MSVVTEDQIGEDVRATVEAIDGIVSCAWPPPENPPAYQGPAAWVDLGPIQIDQGNLETDQITVSITVATPRKGDYPNEYRLILEYARKVQKAFLKNIAVAGEAIVITPVVIGKPYTGRYANQEPDLMACVVTLTVQTQVETVNELAL